MTIRPTWITELLDNQRWLPCMFTTTRDRAQRQATAIRQALREAGKPWQGVVRVRRRPALVTAPVPDDPADERVVERWREPET